MPGNDRTGKDENIYTEKWFVFFFFFLSWCAESRARWSVNTDVDDHHITFYYYIPGEKILPVSKMKLKMTTQCFFSGVRLFHTLGRAQFTASVVYFTHSKQTRTCESGFIALEQRVATHTHITFVQRAILLRAELIGNRQRAKVIFDQKNTINPKVANKSMEFIDVGVVAMETN